MPLRSLFLDKFLGTIKSEGAQLRKFALTLEIYLLLLTLAVSYQFLRFKCARDVRIDQTNRDGKVALDAALQAAEKAVDRQNEAFALSIAKSEAGLTKAIDQQGMASQSRSTNLDSNLADVKDRVTRLEGQNHGARDYETREHAQQNVQHSGNSQMIAVVAVGISVVGLILGHLWK